MSLASAALKCGDELIQIQSSTFLVDPNTSGKLLASAPIPSSIFHVIHSINSIRHFSGPCTVIEDNVFVDISPMILPFEWLRVMMTMRNLKFLMKSFDEGKKLQTTSSKISSNSTQTPLNLFICEKHTENSTSYYVYYF